MTEACKKTFDKIQKFLQKLKGIECDKKTKKRSFDQFSKSYDHSNQINEFKTPLKKRKVQQQSTNNIKSQSTGASTSVIFIDTTCSSTGTKEIDELMDF